MRRSSFLAATEPQPPSVGLLVAKTKLSGPAPDFVCGFARFEAILLVNNNCEDLTSHEIIAIASSFNDKN